MAILSQNMNLNSSLEGESRGYTSLCNLFLSWIEFGAFDGRSRSYTKVKLGDFNGALNDANEAVKVYRGPFYLLERGIMKRVMGDLQGALADLDEALNTDDYACLKHRGYVKFLMGDEEGARADAERALRVKRQSVDNHDYGNDTGLGRTSVDYLGYNLT